MVCRVPRAPSVRILSLIALAALAGCAPYRGYYQPGVTQSRLDADTTDCAVEAVQRVPSNTQIRRGPPVLLPGRRICDRDGDCTILPARYVRGDITTVDVNAPLRSEVRAQCMARRGYTIAEVPPCPSGAPVVAGATLPPLTGSTCVLRSGGRTLFATAGR